MTLNPDQFHPNVDHYRDGGMGGVGEDHSVVGMVPTHVLTNYREYDRTEASKHPGSAQTIESLRADLRAGKGFHTPAMLLYDHKNQWAKLGEGNHRVAAAEAEAVPHIPTRVVRANLERDKEQGVGAPATHNDPGWSRPHHPYVPSDLHPSFLNLTAERPSPPTPQVNHEAFISDMQRRYAARSHVDIIQELLRPSNR